MKHQRLHYFLVKKKLFQILHNRDLLCKNITLWTSRVLFQNVILDQVEIPVENMTIYLTL